MAHLHKTPQVTPNVHDHVSLNLQLRRLSTISLIALNP
jgi:hypothetical protein